MNSSAAYARLQSLELPVLRVSEAAAVLGQTQVTAAQTMRRLAATGLIQPLRHGVFWISRAPIDPWVALEYLAAPYPAYASLYSALYVRGALSQVPVVHYAVTLGRTRRIVTKAGTYSLHRVPPELFGGFETLPTGAKLASVEKALFDLAYLAATRSRLFARPPEIELPRRINSAEVERWIKKVRDPRRRKYVRGRLETLLPRKGRRRRQ